MSFSTYLSFCRNLTCVIKAFAADDSVIKAALGLPGIPDVSLIELLLGLMQFGGMVIFVRDGIADTVGGVAAHRRSSCNRRLLEKICLSGKIGGPAVILRQIIEKDSTDAIVKIFEGIATFMMGTGFYFLGCNSFHIHGPTHPWPLYLSTIVFEVFFFVFICSMIRMFWMKVQRLKRTNVLAMHLQETQAIISRPETLLLAAENGYVYFLAEVLDLMSCSVELEYRSENSEAAVENDLKALQRELFDEAVAASGNIKSEADETRRRSADKKEVSAKVVADSLRQVTLKLRCEVAIDLVILVLNVIAFYGYGLGVLAFLFPGIEAAAQSAAQGSSAAATLVKPLFLGMTSEQADFYGFLSGDAAWTIEPALILSSPYITTAWTMTVRCCATLCTVPHLSLHCR